jgi:FMN-dependent NADH-azoreductase
MKKLLHIIATPRGAESRTLKVSAAFLETFRASHDEWVVEELNLFEERLPPLTVRRVDGKYLLLEGHDLFGDTRRAWEEIEATIERFLSADAYLISTPMWNFSIPYELKHYLDIIVQPKYLFTYAKDGRVEGLVKNKRAVIIMSRGGDYRSEATRSYDFQEKYLRTILGYVGLTDVRCVIAQPMDGVSEDRRKQTIGEAASDARKAAEAL